MKDEPGAAPVFYYDLASPLAYLAAERIIQVLPPAEWVPVRATGLPAAEGFDAFRCQADREAFLEGIERTAERRGLQPLRWPDPFPFDSDVALRAATYAKQIGRVVAFSLAAFRQAFAGGRDLSVTENVLIAASACEMHPTAVLRGVELRSVQAALDEATALAVEREVRDVPAIWVPAPTGDSPLVGRVFHGDEALEAAASALA